MLTLRGSAALSDFRKNALLRSLQETGIPVVTLASTFLHLVNTAAPLSDAQTDVLSRLLSYGPRRHSSDVAADQIILIVTPRPGTISPWSSKATDIARICGLSNILRIERAIEFRVSLANPSPQSSTRLGKLMANQPTNPCSR